jgi:hypothetical protein
MNLNTVNVKMLTSQLMSFRLKNTNKNMRSINPFCIEMALDAVTGKVMNVSQLKKGTPLVEVQNEK